MINLLPRSAKKNLQNEHRLRVGVIALCALFALELLTALLLAPAYYSLASTTNRLTSDLAARKGLTPPGSGNAQHALSTLTAEMALLDQPATAADVPASTIMNEVLAGKTSGIGISAFAYGRTGDKVAVQLGGTARTREDLISLQHSLENDPRFGEVKFAQSFITKKTNIDFQLTVTLK